MRGPHILPPKWRRLSTVSLVFLLSGLAMSCGKDTWDCHVYPNRNDLTKFKYIGRFDSLEACRAAGTSELERLHRSNSGDYECGKNCKGDPYTNLIYEETTR